CFFTDYFFFQAEDGIRDFHVTGVQTCALPIYEITTPEADAGYSATYAPVAADGFVGQYFDDIAFADPVFSRSDPVIDFDWGAGRSEERRVGKEWTAG